MVKFYVRMQKLEEGRAWTLFLLNDITLGHYRPSKGIIEIFLGSLGFKGSRRFVKDLVRVINHEYAHFHLKKNGAAVGGKREERICDQFAWYQD